MNKIIKLKEFLFKNFDCKLLYLTLFVIILCGIILRLKVYFFNNSFWYDESTLGLNVINKNYLDFFKPLDYKQVCPPPLMILSKFILNISGAHYDIYARDLMLRLIPMMASLLSLPLFALLAHKMFKNIYLTCVSSAIFAFNICAVSYTGEFKQYSTELLISVILLLLFYFIDIKNDSPKKLCTYSAAFCLAPWFSSSSFFILFAGFLVILIDAIKQKADLRKLLIIYFPFLISFLIFLFCYYIPIKNATFKFMQNYWENTVSSFFELNKFGKQFTDWTQKLIKFPYPDFLIAFCLVNIAIFLSKKNYRRIILILLPVALCILASFLRQYPYHARLILFLLPMFAIIYSQFCHFLKNDKFLNVIFAIIMIFVSIQLASKSKLSYIYHKSYARELFLSMTKDDPKLDNVFIGGFELYTYYAILCKDINSIEVHPVRQDFNKSEADKMLDKFPVNTEGYVFIPHKPRRYASLNEIKKYMFNNKRVKILSTEYSPYNKKEKSEYLIKFVKLY